MLKFLNFTVLCSLWSGILVSSPAVATQADIPSEAAVSAPAQFDTLRNEIRARVAKGEFPSFAVGVIRGNRVVWSETFGWADREAHIAATPTTTYGLASLGKSITATAAITLVEHGKVGLDDRVANILSPVHLTIYEGPAGGPTLRQLLNMTGGIPHGALTYTDQEAAEKVTEDRVLQNRAIVVFPPGEVFHYSNFSIAVVDRVIEKVSGRSFNGYLRQAVFEPLGMHQSFVRGDAVNEPEPAARYDVDGKRIGHIYPFPRSSRGMNASLDDLLAYAAFHMQQPRPDQARILSVADLDALHNSVSAVPGAYIALGWGSIRLQDGTRWYISDGRDLGVQSTLSILPASRVAVVCLTNVTGDQADEISFRIANVLVPGFLAQATSTMQALEVAVAPFKPAGDWLGEWRGAVKTADGELPIVMTFEPGGDIKIALENQYQTLLDEPKLGYGLLTGAFLAKLPLEETPTHYHRVEVGLRLDHDRLYGFVFANFANDRGHFEIPTYVSLKRTAVH